MYLFWFVRRWWTTEEFEILLTESLEDVLTASDTIIGLTTRYGSERLLLELIAQCNVHRQQIALYRNRIALVMAKLTVDSLTELELIRVPIQELRSACSELKLLSQELLRDDEPETIVSPKETVNPELSQTSQSIWWEVLAGTKRIRDALEKKVTVQTALKKQNPSN